MHCQNFFCFQIFFLLLADYFHRNKNNIIQLTGQSEVKENKKEVNEKVVQRTAVGNK